MLVLSRKVGQSVVINGPATVQVVKVAGQCARLGITAAPHVGILREELLAPQLRSPLPPGDGQGEGMSHQEGTPCASSN